MIDPFAGGSVRGVVAGKLGRRYIGIDLQARQCVANKEQWALMGKPEEPAPEWRTGDSEALLPKLKGKADFLFTCPPYGDLEVYSDEAEDLSNMDYPKFLAKYRRIIAAAADCLKEDRFACFVVGDLRDKKGMYRGLPWHTVSAFQDCGLHLYNDAILVTAVGSLPIRVGHQFQVGRKLGKTHQNVFVFVKGDPREATAVIGDVEVGEVEVAE